MPRVCAVCTHPKRNEIEKLLIEGNDSLPDIAFKYSLSKWSVFRHKEHTQRFGFKCAECHRGDSCLRCHEQGKQHKRRTRKK